MEIEGLGLFLRGNDDLRVFLRINCNFLIQFNKRDMI